MFFNEDRCCNINLIDCLVIRPQPLRIRLLRWFKNPFDKWSNDNSVTNTHQLIFKLIIFNVFNEICKITSSVTLHACRLKYSKSLQYLIN